MKLFILLYLLFSNILQVSNNKSIDLLIYFNKLPLELKFDFCDKIFDTTKP